MKSSSPVGSRSDATSAIGPVPIGDADAELFARRFAAPGTSLQLWAAALRLDDAGETLACANYGDSLNATPEVLALDARGNVLVGVDARGSAMHIDLSRDGELLFAGCKATHANACVCGSRASRASAGRSSSRCTRSRGSIG